MGESKTIAKISVITDSENSYENIGDVDGGFDEIALKKHIENYGIDGLLRKICWMQFQIHEKYREVLKEQSNNTVEANVN